MPVLEAVATVLGALAAIFVPVFLHMHNLKRLEIAELRGRLQAAVDLIQALQVELPNHYIKKDELKGTIDRIFDLLDSIRERLDQKADRNEHLPIRP